MKRRGFVLLCLVLPACTSVTEERQGSSRECESATSGSAALECEIVALVNQERSAGATCRGKAMPPVPSLGTNTTLMGVARAHADDMAQKNYFSHTGLDGSSPFDRIEAAGYDFSAAGENIAGGNADPKATMQQWMTSQDGHCENIMSPDFVHIGVGYAFSETHDYKHVWVQNFAAPL